MSATRLDENCFQLYERLKMANALLGNGWKRRYQPTYNKRRAAVYLLPGIKGNVEKITRVYTSKCYYDTEEGDEKKNVHVQCLEKGILFRGSVHVFFSSN